MQQSGLTEAQQVLLKDGVKAKFGAITDEDIAGWAREFMTPVAIVQSFADYFCRQITEQTVVDKPVKKAAKAAKPIDAVEVAPAAQEPVGVDIEASDESLEPALFGD